MSEITSSDTIFSITLFRLTRFEIGRSISFVSGGCCLGMGVMVSFLYIFGQCPIFRPVLIILAIGMQIKSANSLIILAGISPGVVEVLVLIF